MIASLSGVLIRKDHRGAVIECGGVGYGVALSLSSLAQLGDEGMEVRLFVHTHVSQDAIRLFGFVEEEERDAFLVLVATSGVGPRLALAVLSAFTAEELGEVVRTGNKASLVQVPGIGSKTADRLLLELKDRLPKSVGEAPQRRLGGLGDDLVSALVHLGFKPQAAVEVAAETRNASPEETDLAVLVRAALRSSTWR